MNWKSIRLSIYAVLLCGVCIVGEIFLFKLSIILGIFGLLLFALPVMLQRKAIDEASGKIDTIIAKYGVIALAVAIGLITILTVALWIKL